MSQGFGAALGLRKNLARLEPWQRRLLPLCGLIVICAVVSVILWISGASGDVQFLVWLVGAGGTLLFFFVANRHES